MNRDSPSGVGDYEITDPNTSACYLPTCPNNYYVQAQVIGLPTIYNSAEEVKSNLNQVVHFVLNRYMTPGIGMYCRNDENINAAAYGCRDYRVRFCCGEFEFYLKPEMDKGWTFVVKVEDILGRFPEGGCYN